jgi:hypothetical protein
VVVNFSSSEGPAQEVVTAIKEAGGDAIAVGADISKQEDIDRSASRPSPVTQYGTPGKSRRNAASHYKTLRPSRL